MKNNNFKIGIIGTGSLGLAFFAFFKRSNYELFAYDKNKELLKNIEKGFDLVFKDNLFKVPPLKTFKSLKKIPFENLDFLIISVKAYDLKDLAKKLQNTTSKTPIVLVQNGLGIEDFFKNKKNLYRFVCHLAVFKDECNKVNVRILKKENFIGGDNEKIGGLIAKAFSQAGIKTNYKRNIKKYVWEKTILNSLLNPLSAVFQKNMQSTLKIKGIDFIINNILKEGLEVGRKEGVKFSKNFEREAINYIRKGEKHLPSMVFDIKKGKTEIDFLNGMISRIGKKHNIKTPVNDFIVSLLKNLKNDRNI